MSGVRSITCPSCGGSLAVKAAGYSVSVGCQYCGALIDVAHPDVAVIETYEAAVWRLPLKLGKRGTLFGTEWETIGALERSDGDVSWLEYLLFNPYAGYRWLVCSEGEWQFGTMLIDRPIESDYGLIWRGKSFQQDYDPAETTTDRVVGEFYWRVRAGDQVSATTYSHGDELLSAEWSDSETNWTHLVAVSEREIGQAFGIAGPGDSPDGGFQPGQGLTGTVGENPFEDIAAQFKSAKGMYLSDLPRMFAMGFVTLIASMLVMIGFGISTSEVRGSASVAIDGPEKTATLGSLTISRSYQPVTIEAYSSQFDNRWVDIDYTLVDRKTQRAFTAYGVVEHYSGYDSDGAWSEGSYHTTTKFSAVPSGTYDIVADVSAHTWNNGLSTSSLQSSTASNSPWGTAPSADLIEIDIIARAGGILWANLLLELALLFGMPLLILWWRHESDD